MKETEIVRACKEYLLARGLFVWRQNAGVIPLPNGGVRFSGLRGISDILGILPQETEKGLCGILLAVEVKTPKGKLRPDQEAFLSEVNRRGGLGIVVRSVDELEEALKEYPFKPFPPSERRRG